MVGQTVIVADQITTRVTHSDAAPGYKNLGGRTLVTSILYVHRRRNRLSKFAKELEHPHLPAQVIYSVLTAIVLALPRALYVYRRTWRYLIGK